MSTPSKRPREEDEVDVAIQELEAAVGRDAELKIKGLQGLAELIDPAGTSMLTFTKCMVVDQSSCCYSCAAASFGA